MTNKVYHGYKFDESSKECASLRASVTNMGVYTRSQNEISPDINHHMTSNPTAVDSRTPECETSAYYVLGGRHLGSAVAQRLRADGYTVCVVDESYARSETPGLRGDPADIRTLEAAGVGPASTVVVATRSDSRNLLIAQLVRANFAVKNVIVLANLPDRLEMFTEAGHDPVCATSTLSDTLVDTI